MWEQRKFADSIDVKSGKDYKHLNSGPIPVYGTGGYMLSVDRALSDIDAIGIGRKGTIDKPYLLKAPFWTVDTLFYAVPKQNIDLQFSLSIFKKINWKKFDESTGVPSLSKTVINSVGASVPSYEEQQKIGSFFKQLDNTITLHHHKLELLKQAKQGFLQQMFPKEGENVPELRFANFSEAWEQRKLKEISEKVTNKNKEIEFTETLTNSAEFGIISQTDFFDKEISNKKNIDGYYIVKPDDFVYNPRISNYAPVGPIKRNNLGRTGIMSPLYYVFTTKEINKDFLEKYFDSTNWHKFMKLNGDSGARSDRFAIKDSIFVEMPISCPSSKEQQAIGQFFKQIDDTITLYQQKLTDLEVLKQAYLQKMFI